MLLAAAAVTLCGLPEGSAVAAARPKLADRGKVISVDGPGRLTVKTKRGAIKLRLYLIDGPQVGECGAAESTAALTKLAKRRGGRVRYVLGGRKPDADGAYPAFVGPQHADLTEHSLGRDLVVREWARSAATITVSEDDGAYLYVGGDPYGARPARGVWALCGGQFHLPLATAAPAHAPAVWSVSADGITDAIGPITLSPELTPANAITLAKLRALAPVEAGYAGRGQCIARIPSLELVAYLTTDESKPACETADVYGFSSTGPGAVSTSNGLRTGSTRADAVARFRRLPATSSGGDDDLLPLAGYKTVPWAWQTLAGMSSSQHVSVLFTSAAPQGL